MAGCTLFATFVFLTAVAALSFTVHGWMHVHLHDMNMRVGASGNERASLGNSLRAWTCCDCTVPTAVSRISPPHLSPDEMMLSQNILGMLHTWLAKDGSLWSPRAQQTHSTHSERSRWSRCSRTGLDCADRSRVSVATP